MSQIALSMDTIQRNLTDHEAEIQLVMNKSVEKFKQGLSLIDRSKNEWTLKLCVTIVHLHLLFLKAYQYMERASKKLYECKVGLEANSRDMAQQSTELSEDIRKLTQNLKGLTASLELKEKVVKKKSNSLRSLRNDLSSKKEKLEKTRKKRKVALAACTGMFVTSVGLLAFGPLSLPTLKAAAAAEATAAACVVIIEALEKDVREMKIKIDSSQEECRLTSNELRDLKEAERKLQTEKDAKEEERKSLEDARNKLREQITEVADYLKQVKAFCTVLETIVNKFDNLKDESDPENYTNLSALKIPVRELENSLRHMMITF